MVSQHRRSAGSRCRSVAVLLARGEEVGVAARYVAAVSERAAQTRERNSERETAAMVSEKRKSECGM